MQRRQWDANTTAMAVIEGLTGKPGAQMYHEHQISQSLSCQWWDHVLAPAAKSFEGQRHTKKEARLERENARLKKRVGALLLELKKTKVAKLT
jgi:hypothetical protein